MGIGEAAFGLPNLPETLSPILATVPMQMLTYQMAALKGLNPDTFRRDDPRNAAAFGLAQPWRGALVSWRGESPGGAGGRRPAGERGEDVFGAIRGDGRRDGVEVIGGDAVEADGGDVGSRSEEVD